LSPVRYYAVPGLSFSTCFEHNKFSETSDLGRMEAIPVGYAPRADYLVHSPQLSEITLLPKKSNIYKIVRLPYI